MNNIIWQEKLGGWLTCWILPAGLFILLTGMLWAKDVSLYHRFFYLLVVLPALILFIIDRGLRQRVFHSPVCQVFIVFACYVILSVAWSDSPDTVGALVKRPFFVLMLLVAGLQLGYWQPDLLVTVSRLAAYCAVAVGAYTLADFMLSSPAGARLAGLGVLHNPLSSSHVYGFFLVQWIAFWILSRRLFSPIPILAVTVLGAVILATGSRTPLLALGMTVVWLAVLTGGRRGLGVIAVLLSGLVLLAVFFPETLTQRGFSYRPQIWQVMLGYISENLWFGHGYNSTLEIRIDGVEEVFSDPHNITLSVLYETGVIGFVGWLTLYGVALFGCWKQRWKPLVFISAATLFYGLIAGMTEGGSFLSRPKEHWFIIWIPFLFYVAASTRLGVDNKSVV